MRFPEKCQRALDGIYLWSYSTTTSACLLDVWDEGPEHLAAVEHNGRDLREMTYNGSLTVHVRTKWKLKLFSFFTRLTIISFWLFHYQPSAKWGKEQLNCTVHTWQKERAAPRRAVHGAEMNQHSGYMGGGLCGRWGLITTICREYRPSGKSLKHSNNLFSGNLALWPTDGNEYELHTNCPLTLKMHLCFI